LDGPKAPLEKRPEDVPQSPGKRKTGVSNWKRGNEKEKRREGREVSRRAKGVGKGTVLRLFKEKKRWIR